MYQIILTENDKKVKILYTYNREYDALYRFNNISNKEVLFPKKQIYKNKILTEVNYHILLLKKRCEGDKNIIIRDKYGKLLENFEGDPEWVVIDRSEYNIDEQFSVTGANRKLNLQEIINHVVLSKLSDKNPKQLLILNNKIVVEGINLNMITCKNIDEAIRLYNKIRIYCYDKNVRNIIFFGSIPKQNKKTWYKKIHEQTGVGYNRLYRSCSR